MTDHGLLTEEQAFIGSNHVKVSANKQKYNKKVVQRETPAYEEEHQEQMNLNCKQKIIPFRKVEHEEIKKSTTNPESHCYIKKNVQNNSLTSSVQ